MAERNFKEGLKMESVHPADNESLGSGKKLTYGTENDPFLPKLIHAINRATEIDIAVSFIQPSGLVLLIDPLLEAMERNASLRIVTSDYLCITHPVALRELMLLAEKDAGIKIFQCEDKQSFHMKSYIFVKTTDEKIDEGVAFVGSNNISKSALTNGIEWALRYDFQGSKDIEFKHIRDQFAAIFNHRQSIELSHGWIDSYITRHKKRPVLATVVDDNFNTEVLEPVTPYPIQVEALDALNKTRENGHKRGVVVMGTGMGKTWLSAFDVKQMNARKVLFIAHREEILLQAQRTFLHVQPDATSGLYKGDTRTQDADLIFASIQTIGRESHLDQFPSNHFDYVIVDEFHHAGAPSYQALLKHFKPEFLLGITATPERTDQADILAFCDHNLVFEANLVSGIRNEILVPFDYYGIWDTEIDYKELPWRNGRFDPQTLEYKFATQKRAANVLKNWQEHKQRHTLAFCVSRTHADYMAEYFNAKGFHAAAVYSGSKLRRNEAIRMLEKGQIDVLFTVDLFNEGVDIPPVDTILILRPTESKILFLQQLGRGLRKNPATGKTHLVVLDFIGNHKSFLNRSMALSGSGHASQTPIEFINDPRITEGCFVNIDPEIINFWRQLVEADKTPMQVYNELSESLDRRPTASEYYYSGGDIPKMRKQQGSWFDFAASQNFEIEKIFLERYKRFLLRAIETTSMTKCFKAITLKTFLELDGLNDPPTIQKLAEHSWYVLKRYPELWKKDVASDLQNCQAKDQAWFSYWKRNPINFYCKQDKADNQAWFTTDESDRFCINIDIPLEERDRLAELMLELTDLRLAQYKDRVGVEKLHAEENVSTVNQNTPDSTEKTENKLKIIPFPPTDKKFKEYLPFYPLEIAAGKFVHSETEFDHDEWIDISEMTGRKKFDENMFVAQVKGKSMEPQILDGAYCLFTSSVGGTRNGQIVLAQKTGLEDPDTGADFTIKKYWSTKVADKNHEWRHKKIILKALNPNYEDIEINPDEAEDLKIVAFWMENLQYKA